MSETMKIELIRVLPAVVWVVFALVVYLTLHRAFRSQFPRLRMLNGPGFSMDFAEPLLDAARTQDVSANGVRDTPAPSPSQRRAAVSRLEHAAEHLAAGRILWVDDHPEWHSSLSTLFRKVRMTVDTVRSTDEAMHILTRSPYDLIITDMHRETEEPSDTAAYSLIESLAVRGVDVPVILFSGPFDTRRGVPPGIFAYTSSGDNLLQYVIDVMERVTFGVAMRVPARLP